MSPTLVTFLYETANFLVLALALGWLLFKPARAAVAGQRARLDEASSAADRKLAEAEAARAEIERARQQLQGELQQLRAQEIEAARQAAEQILSDARAAAQREREMLRRQAVWLEEDEGRKLADAAATTAAAMVERLLEQIHGPDLDTALVLAACARVRALGPRPLAPVKVETPAEPSAEDRAAIEGALGDAARQAVFCVDPALGAGVRISTAAGLIDASAAGLAGYARQSLIRQLSTHANGSHDTARARAD